MSEEEEFAKLPLTEQFAHKNWKARKGGYETATNVFKTAQPSDAVVRDFLLDSSLWKGAVGDSNVAAQQEALNAYNAFLDAAGTEGARRTRGNTVGPAVEKGLMGRPAAKAAALETLLLLIELDKAEPIIEELLPYLANKQPKIIVATLSALTNIYHAYGCKTVEPKPVVKLLPKVFGHADKNVRAEAQTLTVELYRWLREAMKPLFWDELKDVQQKDLEKLFEPVKAEPSAKQERLLRSQQAAKEAEPAPGAEDEVEDEAGEEIEIDLEPEFEVVDVFIKIPKDFSERLASTKWKDRKEALDETFAAVNVPAIQEGQFDEVLRGCAKSMKDANIAVVAVAANCIEAIAKGLRRSFSRYRGTVLSPMLERFKEKKQNVTDAIAAACDAVFASSGLGDVQTDVLEAMKNKNPQIKEHSTKFLVRCLKATRDAPSMEQTKEIAEAGKKLLAESTATLRDAGAEVLGVLWKIMGDRNMLAHLDGLDEIRKNKIKEFSDAAEVKAKWKPKATAPALKAAAPAARKPATGSKRPAAKKPAAARAASPPLIEDPPLQPRPTTRPASKAPAGLRAPGSGLKAPGSTLQKSALGLKGPSSSLSSPKRQGMIIEDPPPITPAKSTLGRGLAGRPLGKPATAQPSPPPAQRVSDHTTSALSSTERQELSDLRDEIDVIRDQNSALRQEKSRFSSQVAELQVQNAQLIEDHTRDVLQIKAKDTQLVRARSDAETAEDRANTLSREVDRMKREISRLGRAQAAGRDSPVDDGGGLASPPQQAYGRTHSYHAPGARAAPSQYGSANGYGGGKENHDNDVETSVPRRKASDVRSHASSRPMSNGSSGRETPESTAAGGGGGASATTSSVPSLSRSHAEGQESWRRAAEVTQNLKARIEMMKARQNIGRGQ